MVPFWKINDNNNDHDDEIIKIFINEHMLYYFTFIYI